MLGAPVMVRTRVSDDVAIECLQQVRQKELCAECARVKKQVGNRTSCGVGLRGGGDESERETVPGPGMTGKVDKLAL